MSDRLATPWLTVWHVCPNGMRTSWSIDPIDPTGSTCPCCYASFIFTASGWVPVDVEAT